jgi:NAD(P)H-dependent FMN reductase
MSDAPLNIAVIIGSTREGRFGPTIAHWFAKQVQARADMDPDLIDLATLDLPVVHPLRPTPAMTAYHDRLERADAFVVVTPEYNHGYPGALKHAIDLARDEWRAKPVAFVSYGGMSGGLRAVEQLRQVFAELRAMTVRDTVSFHMAHALFDPTGEPIDPTGCNAAARAMLDDVVWWATALRAARSDHTNCAA